MKIKKHAMLSGANRHFCPRNEQNLAAIESTPSAKKNKRELSRHHFVDFCGVLGLD